MHGVPNPLRSTVTACLCRSMLFLGVASILAPTATPLLADEPPLSFEREIRSIFRAHCYDCHGATEEIEGGLDLRLVRFIRQGGDSGPALTGRSPDDSLLWQRVASGEMPPGEKKVTPAELATLRKWIEADTPTLRPEPETIPPGLGITPEERSFWAFQPITPPQLPTPTDPQSTTEHTSPLDLAFLLDELQTATLPPADQLRHQLTSSIAPTAPRPQLIARAYFDLTGLPPSFAEMERWSNLADADWYDQLLTHLLASPHYGERWGRHWLDTAGYADSEGYTTADAPRAWAWKYRDWVINALNQNKPFDQFITEQLAGDELAGPITGDLTAQQIDLLTATGFLRMAADGTGSGANTPEARNQVMADTLKIVGTSLLGLSLQCAQCHDHRYDPIPQTDYFALRAVFEPALDWQAWKVPAARQVSLYTEADRQQAAQIEAEAQVIAKEKQTQLDQYMAQALDMELGKYEEPLREKLRTAYQTAANQRNDEQKQLLMQNPSVNITPGNLYQYIPDSKPKLEEFDKRIAEVRAKKPPESFIRALVEPPNHVPDTKLFYRGDFQQPKQSIAPAPLTVAVPEDKSVTFPSNDESLPTTGRRLAFARWLTNRDNPLFARVIVNRIWLHHFGTGLVNTPGDFGTLGARPSHPQLLDWLADEFIASGWDLKKLHRTIMSSRLYRQTTTNAPNLPDQSLIAHNDDASDSIIPSIPTNAFNRIRRLEAEAIRDYMLAASGQLDLTLGGPTLSIKEDDTGQVIVEGSQKRRSLYIQARRSQPVAMLQSFDAPVMETNCERRTVSTVATQSLMLLNGQFILDQAALLADRAAEEPVELSTDVREQLPEIPAPAASAWAYGFGDVDAETQQVSRFTPLAHWTGGQWQAGTTLPDAAAGWVLLNAAGGHPDIPARAVIRRWTAPYAAQVSIQGNLGHGSPNGDGVRGRIVSSRHGLHGEWTAHNSSLETPVTTFSIEAGDTIDFVVDCREHQTSDSFSWPVTISTEATGDLPARIFSSQKDFHGPADSPTDIPGQIVCVWQLTYLRNPSTAELQLATKFIGNQLVTFESNAVAVPEGRTPLRQAMTNLSQAILSSNEFLYVE